MLTDNTMGRLISIIMPVYNGANYIAEAIQSVLKQSYKNWELLIINDGSTDISEVIIYSFTDNRITYFKQENKGVGSARNLGLANMNGNYFCFLDADDVFPENSLTSRLSIFQKYPEISFVDGNVQYVDESLKPLNKSYIPNYQGEPFNRLIELDANCYFGNTWMIKRDKIVTYHFDTNITHAEDLLFYITISKGKTYTYTGDCILYYRQRNDSAMKNLKGLEIGYLQFYNIIKRQKIISANELYKLKRKIKTVLFKSYIKTLKLNSAMNIIVHKF